MCLLYLVLYLLVKYKKLSNLDQLIIYTWKLSNIRLVNILKSDGVIFCWKYISLSEHLFRNPLA